MGFKVGATRIVITPPVGVELAGYGFGPSVGILDDLEAQALYFESGGVLAAVICADLLTVGESLVADVRARIQDELGIPADHVLLSASHSHSSPTARPLRQWGRVDENYIRALDAHLVGAVAMAQRGAVEAQLGYGLGRVEMIAENRRGEGSVDPQVPVLCVDSIAEEGNSPLALLFNYGCHPVSLHSYRNLISPDYPGYARAVIRHVLGQSVVSAFTLGGAGDINPAGYVAGSTSPRRSRQIGAILGCEVAKVALDPICENDPLLRVVHTDVELPVELLPPVNELISMRNHWAAEAERMRSEGVPWPKVSEAEIKRDWAADAIAAQESGEAQESVRCEIQAMRLGSVAVLALPLEVFSETALAIKDASPAAVTLLSSNSNGGVGYLPTEDAYRGRDYTNPRGLAPKVYGLYALSSKAEPLLRRAALQVLQGLFETNG